MVIRPKIVSLLTILRKLIEYPLLFKVENTGGASSVKVKLVCANSLKSNYLEFDYGFEGIS